jgi:hypothetical protein
MPSLLELNRDIRDAIRALQMGNCCPDNTSLFGDEIGTDLTPGIGDPPATWGETQEVADWDEWYNLLCGASYRYVDYLIASANQAQTLINQAALTIAIIAAILALASGAGLLIAIKYTAASGAFNAIVAVAGTQAFAAAAAAFEEHKDRIVCAIMDDNLRAEMEDILGPIIWPFYTWVDWENATNILWEGGVPGGEQLEPVVGVPCPDCEEPIPPEEPSGLFFWSFSDNSLRDRATSQTVRGQEIWYYREYSLVGDSAGHLHMEIRTGQGGGGVIALANVHITHTKLGTTGDARPLDWRNDNNVITKSIPYPDWDGYSGVDPAAIVQVGPMRPGNGYLQFYIAPIA